MTTPPDTDPAVLRASRKARRKLDRAAGFAGFNAWTFAVLAGLSLLFAVLDPTNLIIAIVMGTFAALEFRGRAALLRLEPAGPRRLMHNQWLILAGVLLYCGWLVVAAQAPPAAAASSGDPAVDAMMADIMQDVASLSVILYAVVAVLAGTWQVLMAGYYRRVATRLDAYLHDTPAWIVDAQRR